MSALKSVTSPPISRQISNKDPKDQNTKQPPTRRALHPIDGKEYYMTFSVEEYQI